MSDLSASVEAVLRGTVPSLATMGVEVPDAARGRVRTRLPFRAENGNHIGTVYAGVLFSFLESSGGALGPARLDQNVPALTPAACRERDTLPPSHLHRSFR